MIKYAKIINENTNKVDVGLGNNTAYYSHLGMTPIEVEQAYNGEWYVQGYAPQEPAETSEEKLRRLEKEYEMPRVLREAILAEGSSFSDFNKARAQELETLAEEIRVSVITE